MLVIEINEGNQQKVIYRFDKQTGAPSSPIKAMELTVSQSEGTLSLSLRLAELAAHPSLKFFSSECHSRVLNGEALADEF
jgi:hypothetical protein